MYVEDAILHKHVIQPVMSVSEALKIALGGSGGGVYWVGGGVQAALIAYLLLARDVIQPHGSLGFLPASRCCAA